MVATGRGFHASNYSIERSSDTGWHAGEVRRYLRLARFETGRKRSALIRLMQEHGRAAWHMAEMIERRG